MPRIPRSGKGDDEGLEPEDFAPDETEDTWGNEPADADEAVEDAPVEAAVGSPRVSVVNEPGDDEEYQWHTGLNRPTGVPDAVEFVDVHKAFGRNKILRGLNMGIPEGKISM